MALTGRQLVRTPVLEIEYATAGPADGPAVILLHGFPYDIRSFDDVADLLAPHGLHVIAPMLRGFGGTRFRAADAVRSGQQAALGHDLLDLMDALSIERAVVGGFDWGGRAACIAAALHPERIAGLVTVGGYNIQDISRADEPHEPAAESAAWYVSYFQTERGRRGLERYRTELCALLWRQWSPTWARVDEAFAASATSLAGPDFVDVVIHSYRHRRRAAPGDPRYDRTERALAASPPIAVPTIALDALDDGLGADDSEQDRPRFTGPFEVRRIEGAGHDLPQERPEAFAAAIRDLVGD